MSKKLYGLSVYGNDVFVKAIKTDEGFQIDKTTDIPIVIEHTMMGLNVRPFSSFNDIMFIGNEHVLAYNDNVSDEITKLYDQAMDRLFHPEKYETAEQKAKKAGLVIPEPGVVPPTGAKPDLKLVK